MAGRAIRQFLCVLAACFILSSIAPAHAADQQSQWAALKSPGHIAFIRHALAPGGGDPDNFRLGDCSTQRNLSDGGRRQAKRTGEAFRANGIAEARVFSSQWCRCSETAELLGLGPVTPLPPLNSIHGRPEREAKQINELRETIGAMDLSEPVVMSTHHSVIVSLMNASPSSGEIVVVRREENGTLSLAGKIMPQSTE